MFITYLGCSKILQMFVGRNVNKNVVINMLWYMVIVIVFTSLGLNKITNVIGSLDYCLMYYKSLIDWLYYCWFNHKVICYPDINEMTYKFPDIVLLPKSANFHQTNTYRASTVGHMQLEQLVIQWWTRKIRSCFYGA